MELDYLLVQADARRIPVADGTVDCIVTSPPYFALRDYGNPLQLGLEPTPEAYVAAMVGVFRECRRVLKPSGTLFLNVGDSYAQSGLGGNPEGSCFQKQASNAGSLIPGRRPPPGLKPKDRIGIPHMLVFALRADGWYWRDEIVWHKPNPMPESVTDRTTKAHEFVFLLTKSGRYFWDQEAVKEPSSDNPVTAARKTRTDNGSVGTSDIWGTGFGQSGRGCNSELRACDTRNPRSVWMIPTRGWDGAHFATMAPELAERCVKAGSSEHGVCPLCGVPWVRVVEKDRVATRPGVGSKVYVEPPVHPDSPVRRHNGTVCGNRDPQRHTTVTRSTGWVRGCGGRDNRCPGGDPVPAVVFDPFNGSGTTGEVARQLGRRYVGTEINPDYLALAAERVGDALKPRSRFDPSATPEPIPGQLNLFDALA